MTAALLSFVTTSVRGRGEVGLAVVHLVRGVSYSDFEGVELGVGGGRGEGEAVFVANELGDFGVGAGEIVGVGGEIDAGAGEGGEFAQGLVGFGEAFYDGGAVGTILRGKPLVLPGGVAE